MKKLITITTFLFSLLTYSQDATLLDKANGYKDFKFGTKIEDYSSLKYIGQDDSTIVYRYIGTDKDLHNVFNLKADYILLSFDNQTKQLVNVQIYKTYTGRNNQCSSLVTSYFKDYEQLISNYKEILGICQPIGDSKDFTNISCGWAGDKAGLLCSAKLSDMKQTENSDIQCLYIIQITFLLLDSVKTHSGF